jgi:hypothetical protein
MAGSSVNAAVAILELPDTISMLGNAASNAGDAIKKFRKGRLMDGIKALGQEGKLGRRSKARVKKADTSQLKTPESVYLEYTFGWTPFFNDVKGALEALSNNLDKGKQRTGKARDDGVSREQAIAQKKWRQSGYTSGEAANVTAGNQAFVSGVVASHQQALLNSLGFLNPLLAVWEKIPYSFVVDYFVNIGGFLEALTATSGFEDVRTCVVSTEVRRLNSPYGEAMCTIGVVRVPYDGASPGSFWGGLFASGISGKQLGNMGALLAQRVRA